MLEYEDELKNFVDNAADGKTVQMSDIFDNLIRLKISDAIEARRVEVATKLFNGSDNPPPAGETDSE